MNYLTAHLDLCMDDENRTINTEGLQQETRDQMSHVFENSTGHKGQAKTESSDERWITSRQGKIKIHGKHQL